MKILYIHSTKGGGKHINDFMSDLLLHGLREVFGTEVIDYPGCWYMYSDEILLREYDKSIIWGKGFTINNTLNHYNSIDRTDIKKKIQKKYFDLVIYGSIRRTDIYINDVLKYNNKVIFIDGEDDNIIDDRYLKHGQYFKRELLVDKLNIKSISFAVPKKKIIKGIDENPVNLLAPLIPGRYSTYVYDNEESYYEMYSKSIFALTYKKLGWDCLRHYEILMNGSIPIFLNLEDCPNLVLTTLPKKKLLSINKNYSHILKLYFPFKIYKKKFLSINRILSYLPNILKNKSAIEFLQKNSEILEIKNELLNYTHQNLTTEKLAKYVIGS